MVLSLLRSSITINTHLYIYAPLKVTQNVQVRLVATCQVMTNQYSNTLWLLVHLHINHNIHKIQYSVLIQCSICTVVPGNSIILMLFKTVTSCIYHLYWLSNNLDQ